MVSASTYHRHGLRSPDQIDSLLGIEEQIQKRVLYDGDRSHRSKCYLGMVVAGQTLVNDPVTIFYLSGFLTPAHSVGCCCLPRQCGCEYAPSQMWRCSAVVRRGRKDGVQICIQRQKLPTGEDGACRAGVGVDFPGQGLVNRRGASDRRLGLG
jgi:hypothetical protein